MNTIMSIVIAMCGVFNNTADKALCSSYMTECILENINNSEDPKVIIKQCAEDLKRSAGIYTL